MGGPCRVKGPHLRVGGGGFPAPSFDAGGGASAWRGCEIGTMRDMPQEQADRLARMVFIRVKHGQLFGHEIFVAGVDVDRVQDDTVHLSIAFED